MDRSAAVFPKTWDDNALMIAGLVEAFFKEVMAKATCLRETIHSMSATNVDPTVGSGFLMEIVFLYDFLRDVAKLDLGKFRSLEGGHEVEIGKRHLGPG